MQKSKSRSGWVAIMAILVGSAAAASADDWYVPTPAGVLTGDPSAAPRTPTVTVLAADPAGLSLTSDCYGLDLRPTQNRSGLFVAVSWPDAAFCGETGTPALPVIRRLFVVPTGATVTCTAHSWDAATLDSAALGRPLVVLPVQPPIEKLPGAADGAVFQCDPVAYAQDADVPAQRVTVQELGIVRGQRLWMLEIRPVTYNPAQQQLTLLAHTHVEIRFDGYALPDDTISPEPGLRESVLNPGLLPLEPERGTGRYIIIVASVYEDLIAPFAAAKTAQGFTVTTNPVASGTTKTQMKNYIQGLWNDPNTRPDYILLVGDTDKIPHWVGQGGDSPATDLYYVCMDGASDWYPDIPIGRYSVTSSAHLDSMIAKTLYYENGPLADPNYLSRAVFMASEDNYTISEGTHNWCINNYLNPHGYTSDKLYCHTYHATTAQVSAAFNTGRWLAMYSGHGSETSWGDGPPFSQSNVNALTNQNMYAFVCSFSCLTGKYTTSECFMETWTRAANKGAAIALGSSVTSYWTEDDIFQKKLFDAMFDPNILVPPRAGPVVNDAKLRYLAYFGPTNTTRRYFEMYNLLGDPSLTLFGPDVPPHAKGDLNCDGTLDFDDIDPFVLALADPAGYSAEYPNCNILLADVNSDGVVDFNDIDPLVGLLSR